MSGGVPAGEALGDLPSRIQGWIGKARARGGDRIELDFATVELLVRLALRATPTPPIEGRDADVERAMVTLDAFLAAYRHRPDHKLARPIADDDLLTWGDLRTILAALQALGGRG